ncbi:hypothetical protein [Terrabacter sp. C0L_2]|uniref:hypothetical protein n=1 Tax=Terrabacter sp. C0L_2 TaxID=3108389 RepID=UPI002ED58528|nr:hypothetical protein U5C87_04930 [Terrabacter sp. C0L_2]
MDRAQAIARRGGIALLAVTPALVVGTAVWPVVLVLGDDVTSVGDAAIGLAGCGLALLVVARVLDRVGRRRGTVARDDVLRPRPFRRLGVGLLVMGAGGVAAFAWALDSTSVAFVIGPPSAAGCRVVVQEHSFLMAGRGTVYAVPGHGLVAGQVSRYSMDDGYRPVDAGTFSLAWTGERGHLEVFGSGVDPVWPRSHEIDCPGG